MKKLLTCCFFAVLCSTIFAFEFNRTPAGMIKGARLKYVSSNSVKIGVGYGDTMGSYWEIGPSDTLVTTGYTLTGLGATTNGVVHYLYIDRTNSSLPSVTIRNSTTAPAWSDDYMGWYDGADRCIGAVWVSANGTLLQFVSSNDNEILFSPISITLASGTISTTSQVWNARDITAYCPVNASQVRVHMALNLSTWTHATGGLWPNGGTTVYEAGVDTANVWTWLDFERDATKSFSYMAFASSTSGSCVITIRAYHIER